MPLIGIIAKKKDIQAIKKEIKNNSIEIIEITKESIQNLKNIKFEEIIFIEDINLEETEYKFMSEIISKSKYLIINVDTGMKKLKNIEIKEPIKLITFGFNSKATITISSVKENKIIICLQRNIKTPSKKIIESKEQEIEISNLRNKKIYNILVTFIINELHNQ